MRLYRPKHHRAPAAKQRSDAANALAFLEMQPRYLHALIRLKGYVVARQHDVAVAASLALFRVLRPTEQRFIGAKSRCMPRV